MQQSSRAMLRLLTDKNATAADSFVNFAAPFLEAASTSARTSTRVKSSEPSWEGERVLLRGRVPLNAETIPLGVGLQLVVRVWQNSMLGDILIGEGVVSLLPVLRAQAATPFCAHLYRGGALSGTLSGEIVVLHDSCSGSTSSASSECTGSEGDETEESDAEAVDNESVDDA
eukprot:COSAG05_NODE_1683_length_4285_cov_2.403727_2_plen_172_part_00